MISHMILALRDEVRNRHTPGATTIGETTTVQFSSAPSALSRDMLRLSGPSQGTTTFFHSMLDEIGGIPERPEYEMTRRRISVCELQPNLLVEPQGV